MTDVPSKVTTVAQLAACADPVRGRLVQLAFADVYPDNINFGKMLCRTIAVPDWWTMRAPTRYLVAAAVALAVASSGCASSSFLGSDDDCAEGLMCAGTCIDPDTDSDNCGGCATLCGDGEACNLGTCTIPDNCTPGQTESCYRGPLGTQGVGSCTSGVRTCGAVGFWGACEGQVAPVAEACANGVDDDCDGATDEVVDADGDGYTVCAGDCCDTPNDGCETPALVNPGAFEVAGNMLDDDCDGTQDNPVELCDAGLPSDSNDAYQYAAALDLCQVAEQGRWGVVSAKLVLADGTGVPNVLSHSIRPDFGMTAVQSGTSMAVFSTGHAADSADTAPVYASYEAGNEMNTSSALPLDWWAANGSQFPNAPGCPQPSAAIANDSVMLELTIKTPTNARSFGFRTNFFSAEYPEFVCSDFNDFFVVLLDSTYTGDPANPADKNIAVYTDPTMAKYPVGVNLAFGDTGLFQVCENGPTGCALGVPGTTTTCSSTTGLTGTGFDEVTSGGCAAGRLVGGATGWLVTSGNVVGGETIKLRIGLWDTQDNLYDSLVLADAFEWSVEASEPGTVIVN